MSAAQPGPTAPLFANFKELAFGLGIYAYFTGWIYAYYYFWSFDVTLASLDIPLYYFVVYAYVAFYSVKGLLTLCATAICLPFIRRHRVLLYIFFVALLPAIFWIGQTRGLEDAAGRRLSGNDIVLLSFEPNWKSSIPSDLAENNQNNRLHFLEETKDRLIVYYQPRPVEGEYPAILVYDVPKSKLVTIEKILE